MTDRTFTYLLGRDPVETRTSMAGVDKEAEQLATIWREGDANTRNRHFTTEGDRERMADNDDEAAQEQPWSGVASGDLGHA